MDLDVKADGVHAYAAVLDGVTHRIVVGDGLLSQLGLTAVEEPLVVRRTLELASAQDITLPAGEMSLEDLGAIVEGFPDLVIERLRN